MRFVDCHTKILQVDSQATVGNGVVVQVTGELSIQSGPMRRFMQTFVLALQSAKQYYVNNDIFRYQDEVFQDSYETDEDDERERSLPTVTANTEPPAGKSVGSIVFQTNINLITATRTMN